LEAQLDPANGDRVLPGGTGEVVKPRLSCSQPALHDKGFG
jgi:hypothetical protein